MDEVQERIGDGDEDEKVAAGDDAPDFASPFATGASLRPASQAAKAETKTLRIRSIPGADEGRSPVPTLPFILRDIPPQADARPTQTEMTQILRSVTQRDMLILQTLNDYRYLSTLQIRQLFFPSLRSAQMRLQILKDLHLLYSWKVIQTPGVIRRPSLIVLSPRGARVVAGWRGHDEHAYAVRAREARDHCYHAHHDLEANGFFVDLAAATRDIPDHGLLMWWGEEHMRRLREATAKKHRWPAPTPDGRATLITPAGKVELELEWDRGTESLSRVAAKVAAYVGFYKNFRNAEASNVLFALPTHQRELDVRHTIWRSRARWATDVCCTFWTTTHRSLREHGPLAAVWLRVDTRSSDPPDHDILARLRSRLSVLNVSDANDRSPRDCIGKPRWWDRRPGGGQAA